MSTLLRTPDSLKRQRSLIAELEEQSDRGVAIVGAALLEECLTEALRQVLDQHEPSWKRLFQVTGPLNSFAAKIDLARLLALMTDEIRSDLHCIREIRNEFAHQITHKQTEERLSFELPHLRDKCASLRCVKSADLETARAQYIRACAVLSSDFEVLPLFRSTALSSDAKVTVTRRHAA